MFQALISWIYALTIWDVTFTFGKDLCKKKRRKIWYYLIHDTITIALMVLWILVSSKTESWGKYVGRFVYPFYAALLGVRGFHTYNLISKRPKEKIMRKAEDILEGLEEQQNHAPIFAYDRVSEVIEKLKKLLNKCSGSSEVAETVKFVFSSVLPEFVETNKKYIKTFDVKENSERDNAVLQMRHSCEIFLELIEKAESDQDEIDAGKKKIAEIEVNTQFETQVNSFASFVEAGHSLEGLPMHNQDDSERAFEELMKSQEYSDSQNQEATELQSQL